MTDEEAVACMRDKMIPVSARLLAAAVDEYRHKSLPEFNDLVKFLFEQACEGLLAESGAKSIKEFSKEARVKIVFYSVMQFNAVLPLDYPSVTLALNFIEPPSLSLSVMRRSVVNGLHDALTPGMLIVGHIQSEADYESGTFDIKFKIMFPKAPDDIEEPDPGT